MSSDQDPGVGPVEPVPPGEPDPCRPGWMAPAAGEPPTGPPPFYIPAPGALRVSGLAVASMITGIAAVLTSVTIWAGLVPAIPAIVLGHIARRQIHQGARRGGGMALAGLILGYAGAAINIGILVLFIAVYSACSPNC